MLSRSLNCKVDLNYINGFFEFEIEIWHVGYFISHVNQNRMQYINVVRQMTEFLHKDNDFVLLINHIICSTLDQWRWYRPSFL